MDRNGIPRDTRRIDLRTFGVATDQDRTSVGEVERSAVVKSGVLVLSCRARVRPDSHVSGPDEYGVVPPYLDALSLESRRQHIG